VNIAEQSPEGSKRSLWRPSRWPLYVRVLLGVIAGTSLGSIFGKKEIAGGWTNADLGVIAGLYIQVLTALATPLIFIAIVEAFVRTEITGRQGLKMFVICAVNIAVAFCIGLTILNVWQPGKTWQGKLQEKAAQATEAGSKAPSAQPKEVSLSPLEIIRSYVPKSVAQPFTDNMVLTVAAMAILVGAALRRLRKSRDPELHLALESFERCIVAAFQIILLILNWLIELAPFAICLAVAGVVGKEGLSAFGLVGIFFVTVTIALAIHSLVYYPLSAWLIGGQRPTAYFREGASAILTGFSINSSLATSPLTLQALKRLGVSDSSARLSACVGTNFNNDGITLYEAMTALFIAQAAGMEGTIGQQITILLAALAGSMGIAGIPNSGLIILTLVLNAAKLPQETVQLALPIVYSIDFIVARLRSAVNVMGDIQVAILLDAGTKREPQPANTVDLAAQRESV
jgi:Na+/H+-dicarboxylate symporter